MQHGKNNPHVTLQECIARQLDDIGDYLFSVKGSQCSLLLPPKVLEPYDYNKEAFADKLSDELRKENLYCAFLFDSFVFEHSIDSFREDISNHNYEMLTKLFFSGGYFMDYNPDKFKIGGELFLNSKYLGELERHIASLDRGKILQVVEELTSEVQKERIGIQYVQEISYRIYYLITDEISKIVKGNQEPIYLPRPNWIENPCFMNFLKWKELLRSMITDGLELLEQNYKVVKMGICAEVIEYVRMHYMEQISLRQVADRFFINAVYLGRIFQKTTGVCFNEYTNQMRISEAKRLLL